MDSGREGEVQCLFDGPIGREMHSKWKIVGFLLILPTHPFLVIEIEPSLTENNAMGEI